MTDTTITWRTLMATTAVLVGDRITAMWLCHHASGCDADEFLAILDDPVSQRSTAHIDAMVHRLLAGEPLQYVMGRWAFRHLDLMVDKRVLIPRPETEQLVDIVLSYLRDFPENHAAVVADLGTGSGAIGLSLLHELKLGSITAYLADASVDALDVARANVSGAGRSGINAVVVHGNWYEALPNQLHQAFDVIVSNPPYIADNDPEVADNVLQWEPGDALFAGADGLDAVRHIVAGARDWLKPGGLLAIEIGYKQGDAVLQLLRTAGLTEAQVIPDLSGRDRFARAIAPL